MMQISHYYTFKFLRYLRFGNAKCLPHTKTTEFVKKQSTLFTG